MEPKPPHLTIAEEARAIMARRRIRPSEVAASMGMHAEALGRRLRGTVPFSVDEVARLAAALETNIADLYSESRDNA